jgi:hypothetical protein
MDPYLEGYLWPGVHHRLTTEISRRLAPRLKPRYVARLEISIIIDTTPEAEIGIMYPDVEVIDRSQRLKESVAEYQVSSLDNTDEPIPPAPLTIPLLEPMELHLATVEIRDVAHNDLVTCIEILSPVNKREPSLTQYRQKQQRLRQTGVHLLEIDLLRRGIHPLTHPRLPKSPYLVMLNRARTGEVEVWPIGLQEPLPVVPVPLRATDPDIPLVLSAALATIYDEAIYDLSIDYTQPPPPPPFSADEMAWLAVRVQS